MYKKGQYIIHKAARILFLISSPALRIIKVEDGKIPPPPSHPHPYRLSALLYDKTTKKSCVMDHFVIYVHIL